jgi:hypothetical protein
MCHSLIGTKQSVERQGGAALRPRPDSERTIRSTGWVAPPTLPGLRAAAGCQRLHCALSGLGPSLVPGRRREEGHSWEAPNALLAGVPRGLGLGRMVHTWVAASASPGSGVCLGTQVSFLGGSVLMAWPSWLVQERLRLLLGWGSCPSRVRKMVCFLVARLRFLAQYLPFWLCKKRVQPGKSLLFLEKEALGLLCWGERGLLLAATPSV